MTAVESIFSAKARPHTDPLIVHVLSEERIHDLFDFDDDNHKAKRVCEVLTNEFWPGPLTLVYKASKKVRKKKGTAMKWAVIRYCLCYLTYTC